MKQLTIILSVIVVALVIERVVFTTQKIKVDMDPSVLRAEVNSELTLKVYPANLLGFKIPFKKAEVQFVVEEGANLVELVYTMGTNTATIRSKGVEGEATIGIYSVPSGIPVIKVLIKILSAELVVLNYGRSRSVIVPVKYRLYKG